MGRVEHKAEDEARQWAFRVYTRRNVLDATKARMEWILRNFKNVVVTTSGGKDSIVNYHLLLEVATKMKRLPVNVLFLDQEIEWENSIKIIRDQMEHPHSNPMWMQMPFRLFNATSVDEHWLYCWDEKEKHRWMREKESYAFTENIYGVDRFNALFHNILRVHFKGEPACIIGGVRCEESPSRTLGLTTNRTYKWITWGKHADKKTQCYIFYPLYDWHTSDVWKAIHDHGWDYNKIYDYQYQRGVPVKDMRISNFHHETSIRSVFIAQEFEPHTYAKATQRLAGLDMAAKMGNADYIPTELPPMFADWKEYRDYLLEHLIDEKWKEGFRDRFARQDDIFESHYGTKLFRLHIASIMTNDWQGIKLANFEASRDNLEIRAEWAKRKKEQEKSNESK